MGLDLLYRNLGPMSALHKTRNSRKVGARANAPPQDLRQPSPACDGSDDVCKSPAASLGDSDSEDPLSPALHCLDLSSPSKKPKNILPKRPLSLASAEGLGAECAVKYCNDPYYSGSAFLWNSMINLSDEKNPWAESSWACNDWNGVGSDLTTNSGTVNSLNEEKNSDIFHHTSSSHSSNSKNPFMASKSLSHDTKNDSTAETTPEAMVTSVFQSVNLTSLNGYQFPSLLRSFRGVNSFLNNHPPLPGARCDCLKEERKEKPARGRRDAGSEREFDAAGITQSNGPPVTVKVYTSWSGDSEHTASVKKSDRVQLVARSGDWIYVRVMSEPERCGWIPEFTLVEAELLSRKMTTG